MELGERYTPQINLLRECYCSLNQTVENSEDSRTFTHSLTHSFGWLQAGGGGDVAEDGGSGGDKVERQAVVVVIHHGW